MSRHDYLKPPSCFGGGFGQKPKKKVIYLSGPMTGKPQGNYPAFQAAAAHLRSVGFDVISPAELDSMMGITADQAESLSKERYADILLLDLKQIRKADAVYTLPGWTQSGGAQTEVAYARALGIPVQPYMDSRDIRKRVDQEMRLRKLTPKPIKRSEQFEKVEVRVVDPVTGGAKGTKPRRYELLPWDAVGQIAEVYAFGATKYDDNNWRKGYKWSLSFGAMVRHLEAFWNGEDTDPESGLPHLAHAGFHILALLTYSTDGKGTDDRYKGQA